MNIGIVIPCYNWVDSLNRLLVSLEGANYIGEEVDLIFSIDYSGINNIRYFAESFQW